MPGALVGVIGKQRSGKTLIAYKMCKRLKEVAKAEGFDLRVYSNIYSPGDGFITINQAADIPLDLDPKIVFIDEIYNGCDAQDYRKLKDISIFINTLGKQNCLFLFTSIEAGMVYNRIRNQMNCCILVKGTKKEIFYKFILLDTLQQKDFVIEKSSSLFQDVLYDTNFIPLEFDWSMNAWMEKLQEYYRVNYGISMNFAKK